MNHQHWSPAFKRSKDGTRNKNICLLIQLFSQNLPNIAYNQIISHHIHTLVNTFEFAYHHHHLYEISPSYQNDNYIFNHSYGSYRLHGTGAGTGNGKRWVLILCYVLYTLPRDRHKEPLFSIVVIPVPVLVLVPVPCSVYESLPINWTVLPLIFHVHFPECSLKIK